MKIGQDLNSLVRELDRRRDNMKDLLADTRAMEAAPHMVEGDRMGSVSYTHLTLPTIYSV